MSWLNLNQSLNSIKGQITNFATEVLSDGVNASNSEESSGNESQVVELEARCHDQELEIAALKKLNEELQASLQSERLSKKNGIKEEEANWYWDPPPQSTRPMENDVEEQYKRHIRELQDELSTIKNRDCDEHKLNNIDEELSRLREENKNLTSNLEDLDNQHQTAMEKLLNLKRELQNNFELLKQEHEELKNANDDYAVEVNRLLTKIGERDKQIEDISASHGDYETLLHKYQHLERIHSLLRENAEKFQEENQELHEESFKLQEQVTKLEHDVEIVSKQGVILDMVPKEKHEELQEKLNSLQCVRSTSQIYLDEVNIDDNAKSVIETLKRDINDLKRQLSQSKSGDVADHRVVKSEKIMQLYNRYVNFDLPIDYVGEIPSSTDNIVLFKLESVFKTVNSFKKDMDGLEQKISEKNQTINHLNTQIEEISAENEYLTSDIQHFEHELDEMKKNNDFLISEIAALKNTSKLQPINETHEDNLVKLESELADCNKMNKTFESEIKSVVKELSEVKSEKVILQESLNDLRKKYTSMLDELDLLKTQTKSIEELESSANVTSQNQQLLNSRDDVAELKKRLNMAISKNEQLSIDVHILENDKVLLTKEVDDLKHTLSEKLSSHKELESLKIVLDHKLKDLELKLDELLKHKQDVENDNLHLEQQVMNLTQQKETHNDEILKENSELLRNVNTLQIENSSSREKIYELTNEIMKLKQEQDNLAHDHDTLKQNYEMETQKCAELEVETQALKLKSNNYEELNNSFTVFREENQDLLKQKLRFETELASTDSKIENLQIELDKVISDLNEKDSLIDSLNITLKQNMDQVIELNNNISALNNTIILKNEEINTLHTNLSDVQEKLKSINSTSSLNHEELKKLQNEIDETNKQIFVLNDDISSKHSEISNLTEVIDKNNSDYQSKLNEKDKLIQELQQTITELTEKNNLLTNTKQNEDIAKICEEKALVDKILNELNNNLTLSQNELTEYKKKSEMLDNLCKDYLVSIDKCNTEKNDLISLVNLKHNESLQYHAEIQRLNHIIIEQSNELKNINERKDLLQKNIDDKCLNCAKLIHTIKEKDELIMSFNQSASDCESLRGELNNTNETIHILTKKCEEMDSNVTIHLETVKKLTAENAQLSEKEKSSSKELERLRDHLVEMEDNYTQELMACEQKLTECSSRLQLVEDRAKQTSTVYTSNSIRANQEVETLRNQIKLLERQREEVQSKLSDAEDSRNRSEAALINLQVVLEQFQLDKERDIHTATEKIRNKMADMRHDNLRLHDEIAQLNVKLDESVAGLQAATRLGDQVETKTAQINDLKEQVRTLQISVAAAEERYYNAISNQQDKVDKNLVKNLVMNYVLTAGQNNLNRTQTLRILSSVLDFNQKECEKLGLVKSTTPTDSLAAEFVKFLQNESKPRTPLPDMMSLRSTPSTSRKSSTIGPNPVFELSHKRNTSSSSNNLLFQNMDDAASQKSMDSDTRVIPITTLDTGVNQTRNNEGAILKHVLKDM